MPCETREQQGGHASPERDERDGAKGMRCLRAADPGLLDHRRRAIEAVHISTLIDLLGEEVEGEWQTVLPPRRPESAARLVDEASAILCSIERRLIIAGGGARDTGPDLVGVAKTLGATVVAKTAEREAAAAEPPTLLQVSRKLHAYVRI